MKIGTKSLLYGAHCIPIHTFYVAKAWKKLFGCPKSLATWASFLLHDIGYLGKPNMDGPEGKTHPELGAKIMHKLFDHDKYCDSCRGRCMYLWDDEHEQFDWYEFCLFHSRSYARESGQPESGLCVADKLAFLMEPKWLYLKRVLATGEVWEYMAEYYRFAVANDLPVPECVDDWYEALRCHLSEYVSMWCKENLGDENTWL